MNKSPGQIAYEAAALVTGCGQPWDNANHEKWEAAASAAIEHWFKTDFVMRVLTATCESDNEIWWAKDYETGSIKFLANCNDLFCCGADAEEITPEHIDLFEKSCKDSENNGLILYACRVRGMRPQKGWYQYFTDEEQKLFDACCPIVD